MSIQRMISLAVPLALSGSVIAWAQSGSPPPATPTPTAPTAQTAPATGAVPSDQVGATNTTSGPGAAAAPAGSSNPAVNLNGQTSAAAPVAGANSFTEGEAKSRIESQGFSAVSGLKLDEKGIWRATASKDGKPVSVALDYQGNVVAN